MKRKAFSLLLAGLLCLSLTACAASGGESSAAFSYDSASEPSSAPMEDWGGWNGSGMAEMNYMAQTAESTVYSDPDAKIIRTAELTIQTTDFDRSVSALAALTEENGGYYETAQVESGGYYDQYANRTAYYVVRVPKENFTAFRDTVGEVGHLYSITEDAQDVGEEYYDTEARLETLTTKRERLLALLEQAELMEDIITLENALADVQYEIDMHTTTLRRYDSLIGYSTFRIHLNEVIKITQEPGLDESFGAKLAASLKDGFSGFGMWLQSLALWLARNLIGVVIVVIAAAVAVKIIRKQYKKRRTGPPSDTEL